MAEWIDGIKGLWDGLVKSSVVIGDAFETIKDIFNEILLFIYEIYFFIVFILFIAGAVGLFIVLPIYLIKVFVRNKYYIKKIASFDFKF